MNTIFAALIGGGWTTVIAGEIQLPDLRNIESRLVAYASEEVFRAFQEVNERERAFFAVLEHPGVGKF